MTYEVHLQTPFEGLVECEASMFGGYRPGKIGWDAVARIVVYGILKRDGIVQVLPFGERNKTEVL